MDRKKVIEKAEKLLTDSLEFTGDYDDFVSTAELAEFRGISKMKSIFFTRIVHAKGGVHVARRYGTTGPSGFRNVMLKRGPSGFRKEVTEASPNDLDSTLSDLSVQDDPATLKSLQALCAHIPGGKVGENAEECLTILGVFVDHLQAHVNSSALMGGAAEVDAQAPLTKQKRAYNRKGKMSKTDADNPAAAAVCKSKRMYLHLL
jgi:hypothetical protein